MFLLFWRLRIVVFWKTGCTSVKSKAAKSILWLKKISSADSLIQNQFSFAKLMFIDCSPKQFPDTLKLLQLTRKSDAYVIYKVQQTIIYSYMVVQKRKHVLTAWSCLQKISLTKYIFESTSNLNLHFSFSVCFRFNFCISKLIFSCCWFYSSDNIKQLKSKTKKLDKKQEEINHCLF